MFTFNKFCVGTLLLVVAIVQSNSEALEVTEVEQIILDSKPAEMAILTQLKTKESDAIDAVNTYKCTVGSYVSNRLACTASDNTSWSTNHNVELKLRCPRSGSGPTLTYVEVIFSVTSSSVNCFVNEGAVGLGYIGLTIQAWNTLIFNYSGKFYA